MKERPIIFSAPMVRAILAGAKSQTRRVVKLKPWQQIEERDDGAPWPWMYDDDRADDHWLPCPYGQAGDRLWVREAWRVIDLADVFAPREITAASRIWFEADGPHGLPAGRYRHARFMPRWASRVTLEVTGVRVERLQDISEADAVAEGVDAARYLGFGLDRAHARAYSDLWESLHGPGSWDANPWVWVVAFGRIHG